MRWTSVGLACAALSLPACGGGDTTSAAPAGDAKACPDGSVAADDRCVAVGPEVCAPAFYEGGLCRATTHKCQAGQLPKIDEGCVAVGLPACADVFVDADGVCRPDAAKCGPGTYPVPSEGCVALDGEGCGDAPFGLIPDAAGTVYVDASAAPGGDGTKAAPFTTIAEGLAAAPDDGTVAIAAGTYDEAPLVDHPVSLLGRCPSLVSITGAQDTPYAVRAVIWVANTSGVTLRGLHVSGDGVGVLAVASKVTASGLHLEGATVNGLGALGASTDVTLSHSLIEGTLPAKNGSNGRGVDAEVRAQVHLSTTALLGNRGAGVYASGDGTHVDGTDLLVQGTQPEASGAFGRGVEARKGAAVVVTASGLVGNAEAALSSSQEGTDVTLDASYVAQTAPRAQDMEAGVGAAVIQGGHLTVTGSLFEGNHSATLDAQDPGSVLVAQRSLVASTAPRVAEQDYGIGVIVMEGAQGTLADLAIVGSLEAGALAGGLGTVVTASGLVIEDTLGSAGVGEYGYAFGSGDAATTSLASSVLRNNRTAGVLAVNGGIDVTGCVIEAVPEGGFHVAEPLATFTGIGDGVLAFNATVNVSRTLATGCVRAGLLFANGGGSVSGSVATGNGFGLVIQGDPTPVVASDVVTSPNAQAAGSASDLPVPDSLSTVPAL